MDNDTYWGSKIAESNVWNTDTVDPMDSLLDDMDDECEVLPEEYAYGDD